MTLGERLDCVYNLVDDGCRFLDIGTDHGYLPVKLLLNGKVSKAAAADLREKPLANARRTAEKFGVDMEFFLSDGFDSVMFDYDTAAICGMGGITVIDILSRADISVGKKLVLQPMRNEDSLRRYLWNNGFRIERESFAVEREKPYVVLLCVKTGENTDFEPYQSYTGFSDYETDDAKAYGKKILNRMKKERRGADLTGNDTSLYDIVISETEKRLYGREINGV